MNIKGLLDRDGVKSQVLELLEDVEQRFESIEALAITWDVSGSVKHRYYGSTISLLGVLTLAQRAWADHAASGGTAWEDRDGDSE